MISSISYNGYNVYNAYNVTRSGALSDVRDIDLTQAGFKRRHNIHIVLALLDFGPDNPEVATLVSVLRTADCPFPS
jgi:hypothetical protein